MPFSKRLSSGGGSSGGGLTEVQVAALISLGIADAPHAVTVSGTTFDAVNNILQLRLLRDDGAVTSRNIDLSTLADDGLTEEQVTAIADLAIDGSGHAAASTVSAVNTARITGDTQLGNRVNAEETARAEEDVALGLRIDDVISEGGGIAAVVSDATLGGDGASVPLTVANPFTGADKIKLDNIEAGATADQDLSALVTSAELTALQHVRSVTKVGNHFHVTTVIAGVATTEQLLDVSGAGNIPDGTILYGAGIPASSLGVDGDAYLDNSTGHFYKKGNGVWLQIADAVLIHELTEAVTSLTLLINAKADAAALVQEVQDRVAAVTVLTERLDGRNEYTDGEKLKLGNVEAGATADQDLSALATSALVVAESEARVAGDAALGVRIDNLPAAVSSGGSGNGIVTFEDYHVSAAVSLSVSNRLVATGIVIPEAERTGYWLINFGTVGGYVSGAEFIMDASKLFALPGQVSGTERNLSESLCFTDAVGQGFDACLGHTGIGQILYSSNSAAADTDGITIKRLATRSSVAEVQLFRGDIRKQTPTVIQLAEEIPADVDGVRNVLEISFDTANYVADVDDNGDPTGTETLVNDVGRNIITLPPFNARDLNALDEYIDVVTGAATHADNMGVGELDKIALYSDALSPLYLPDTESGVVDLGYSHFNGGVFLMRVQGGDLDELLRDQLLVTLGVPTIEGSAVSDRIPDAANFTIRIIKY